MNNLSFIFGLSSLLGLVITGIVTIFAVLEGNYGTQANVVIFSLAAINLALVVVSVILVMHSHSISQEKEILQPTIRIQEEKIKLLNVKLEKMRDDYSEVADILHSIQDQLRDRIFELTDAYAYIVSGKVPTKTELIDLERTNEMFYLFVVNNM